MQNQRLSNQELNQINTIKPEQSIYSSDNPVFQLPPSLTIAHEAKPDLSIVDESEISSLQPVQAKKTNGHTIQGNSIICEYIFSHFSDDTLCCIAGLFLTY